MAREQTVWILSGIHVHYVAFDKITKLTTEEVFLTVNDLHNIIHIVLHAWFLSRWVIPANKMGHSYLRTPNSPCPYEQVKQFIGAGRTEGRPCIVIQPLFYQSINLKGRYTCTGLHTFLTEEKKGKSEGRKISHKTVRVTYVHPDVFHPDCLKEILSGQQFQDILKKLRLKVTPLIEKSAHPFKKVEVGEEYCTLYG